MEKRLLLTNSSDLIQLPVESIVCLQAHGNYTEITLADTHRVVVTMQLGQIEKLIVNQLGCDNCLMQAGRSLVVNRDFIIAINLPHKRIVLSDCRTFRHELNAPKDALKAIKESLEAEKASSLLRNACA